VVLDGATLLTNAALNSGADNGLYASVIWAYFTDISAFPTIWQADAAGFEPALSINTTTNKYNLLFGTDALNQLDARSTSDPAVGSWVPIFVSSDTTGASNPKPCQIFIGDTDVTNVTSSTGGAFSTAFNGLDFVIGGDTFGDNLIGYLADTWIGVGQYLDWSVVGNRRKFMDAGGKPVDLGSDGSSPTGTAPAIFLSIPHGGTPANFATNLGTGGNFSVTGALTLAPSSPSD